jgi:hypothetical protein
MIDATAGKWRRLFLTYDVVGLHGELGPGCRREKDGPAIAAASGHGMPCPYNCDSPKTSGYLGGSRILL